MIKRSVFRAVLASAALALAAGISVAQEWRGRADLEVRVSSRKGGALSGARVELMYRDSREADGPAPVATDSKGRATILGLAAGTWQVEVTHPQFMSFVAVVRLDAKDKPRITASFLEASAGSATPIQVKLLKSKGGAASTPLPRIAKAPRPQPETAPTSQAPEPAAADPVSPEPAAAPEPEGAETPRAEAQPAAVAIPAGPAPAPVESPAPPRPEPEAAAAPPPVAAPEPEAVTPEPTAPETQLEPVPQPAAQAPEPVAVAEPTVPEPTVPEPAASEPAVPEPAVPDAPAEAEPEPVASTAPAPAPATMPEPVQAPAPQAAPAQPKAPTPEPQPAEPVAEAAEPEAEVPAPQPMPAPEPVEVPVVAPVEEPVAEAIEPPAAPRPEPQPEPPIVAPAPEPVEMPKPTAPEPEPEVEMPEPTPPAPAPAAEPPAASPTPAEETQPAPEAQPREAVAAEEPSSEPAPSPTAGMTTWRSGNDSTCPDCQPGEWSVTVAARLDQDGSCEATSSDSTGPMLDRLGRLPALQLAGFAGSLEDAGSVVHRSDKARLDAVLARAATEGCRVLGVILPRDSGFIGFQYVFQDDSGASVCLPNEPCSDSGTSFGDSPHISKGAGSTVVYGMVHGAGGWAQMTIFFAGPTVDWAPQQ